MRSSRSRNGELEAAVMDILWEQGDWTSGSAVHAALQPTHPVAYTTALTVLVRLCEKSSVERRRLTGRAYVFRAVRSREASAAARISQVLSDIEDRSAVLTKLIDQLDDKERARLRVLLDDTSSED